MWFTCDVDVAAVIVICYTTRMQCILSNPDISFHIIVMQVANHYRIITKQMYMNRDNGRVEEHDCLVWSPNQEWMFRKIKVKPFFPNKEQLSKRPINPADTFPFDPLVHDFVVPNTQDILARPGDPLNQNLRPRPPFGPPGPPPPSQKGSKPGTITRLPPPPPPRRNLSYPFNPNERFPPVQPFPIYSYTGPNNKRVANNNKPPVPIVRHPGLYPFPPAPVVTKPKPAGQKRPPYPPYNPNPEGPDSPTKPDKNEEDKGSQESDELNDASSQSQESESRENQEEPNQEVRPYDTNRYQQRPSAQKEDAYGRPSLENEASSLEEQRDQTTSNEGAQDDETSVSQESEEVERERQDDEYGPKDTPYYFQDHTYSKYGNRNTNKKTKYSDFRLFF